MDDDLYWTCILYALVLPESGMTRQKNTVNILFKNFFVITMGLLVYAIGGFNLMYPGDFNGYIGFAGFGLTLLLLLT